MSIERQTRRPRRRPEGEAAQRGVTLIEVMAVVAIVAVLLALGVPSFREFVARNRLDGAAQELMTSLQYARSEAMRRGAQVTVRLAGAEGSKNWGSGWSMFVDADGDGALDAGEEVIKQGMAVPAPLTLIGSGGFHTFVAFGRDGRLTNAGGGYLVLCDGPSLTDGGQSRARAVVINGAGRVRMAARDGSNVPVTDTGAVASCSNP